MPYFRSLTLFCILLRAVDILTPRFIKEEVGFIEYEGAYVPLCALVDVDEDDNVVMAGTMRSFNFFGFALFPKLLGNLREYPEKDEHVQVSDA